MLAKNETVEEVMDVYIEPLDALRLSCNTIYDGSIALQTSDWILAVGAVK